VDKKSDIVLKFNPAVFARGESVPVTFKKLVNADGLVTNSEPIVETLTVYP